MPNAIQEESAESRAGREDGESYVAGVGIIGESACWRLCRARHNRHSFFAARPFTTLEHFNANSQVFASRSPDRGRKAKSWSKGLKNSASRAALSSWDGLTISVRYCRVGMSLCCLLSKKVFPFPSLMPWPQACRSSLPQ
jgi:hypothetical protein